MRPNTSAAGTRSPVRSELDSGEGCRHANRVGAPRRGSRRSDARATRGARRLGAFARGTPRGAGATAVRVVIAGGGYVGMYSALHLEGPLSALGHELVLVNPENF